MTHYSHTNPNPREKNVGDCTVRAISLANEQSWEDTYLDLCIKGYMLADMPSSNEVWSSYLIDNDAWDSGDKVPLFYFFFFF